VAGGGGEPGEQVCFPFIVGCGRSGTTLLRAMLDSHPDLVVPPESRFVPALLERERAFRTVDGTIDTAAAVDSLVRNEHFASWGMPERSLRDHLGARSFTSVADVVRAMFKLRAAEEGKRRYADKSPPYVMRMGMLAAAFPEARFVHLVRDGRDVALAYLDADFGPDSAAEMALHWRLRVERGRRAGRRLGPERYLEIRYEDLVDDTEPVLRRLCDFIGLDFDRSMLRYQDRVDQLVRFDPEPWNHANLSKPPTPGLRDWREQMGSHDIARFAVLAGATLERFGYERAAVGPTVGDRAGAARVAVAWQARRLRKRLQRA
jgi:hypothetical protein